jgi:hypothetical protein
VPKILTVNSASKVRKRPVVDVLEDIRFDEL